MRQPVEFVIKVEQRRWHVAWPGLVRDVRAFTRGVAADISRNGSLKGSFVLVFADDQILQNLNHRFRKKNRPTNVLSFEDKDEPYGGVALSLETISREALAQNKAFVRHAKHMILHGILHLLGYDHQNSKDARLMEGLEIAILKRMGIANPYQNEAEIRA